MVVSFCFSVCSFIILVLVCSNVCIQVCSIFSPGVGFSGVLLCLLVLVLSYLWCFVCSSVMLWLVVLFVCRWCDYLGCISGLVIVLLFCSVPCDVRYFAHAGLCECVEFISLRGCEFSGFHRMC